MDFLIQLIANYNIIAFYMQFIALIIILRD